MDILHITELTHNTDAWCSVPQTWAYQGSWCIWSSPPRSNSLCRLRSVGNELLHVCTDSKSSFFLTCGPFPSPSFFVGCVPERQSTESCPYQWGHLHHLPHLKNKQTKRMGKRAKNMKREHFINRADILVTSKLPPTGDLTKSSYGSDQRRVSRTCPTSQPCIYSHCGY